MKRILILSDSLGLPRESPEICEFEETWPVLLKKEGYLIHQVSVGGATSGQLLEQIFYHKLFKPDITIVQVGIVDCAPRFVKKYELMILRRMFIIGKWLIKLLNTKTVRNLRKITYTSPKLFELNIKAIVDKLPNSELYFLSILSASVDYETKLPGVSLNINNYNHILKKIGGEGYIDLSLLPSNGVMTDGHHLNRIGHAFIMTKILNQIK